MASHIFLGTFPGREPAWAFAPSLPTMFSRLGAKMWFAAGRLEIGGPRDLVHVDPGVFTPSQRRHTVTWLQQQLVYCMADRDVPWISLTRMSLSRSSSWRWGYSCCGGEHCRLQDRGRTKDTAWTLQMELKGWVRSPSCS